MMDLPPGGSTQQQPLDWRQVVGEQTPPPTGQVPPIAGGPSLANVDKPPTGSQSDVLVKQQVADMQANRQLRDQYAKRAYDLACGCISMWAIMLGTQGFIKALTGIEMWSDKVLIAVTTGVTVSVLAAFLGVIRGLFGANTANGKEKR